MGFIAKFYQVSLNRFLECSRLYRNDIQKNYYEGDNLHETGNYRFVFPTSKDLPQFEKFYEKTPEKVNIIRERFGTGNYYCFAYQDKRNDRIAYVRWLCRNRFYSDIMRIEFNFDQNEAITLDSYTHPDYRYKGLHRKMNVLMLQWIQKNTKIEYVYMVIRCFIPHLSKIPLELGYKPVDRKIYYKKGSVMLFLKQLFRLK